MQVQHSNNTVTLKTFKYLHIYVLRMFLVENDQVVVVFFMLRFCPGPGKYKRLRQILNALGKIA